MEEKNNEENNENYNQSEDEDYGLPKVSYDPVNREQTREPIIMNPKDPQYTNKNTYKKDSPWPILIGLFVVVILAGVFIYLFVFDAAEPVEEPIAKTPPPVEEEVVIPDAEEFENAEQWEEPVEPAKPAVGTISTISSRTGQAYIIAGSFIDVDLATDYGNKLAQEGVSTTVIEPYGKVKYYRLAVAQYPTVGDALNEVDQLKTKYGDNIWVLKY